MGEGKAEGKGAAIWGLISCGVLAPKTCHQTNKTDTASSAELIRGAGAGRDVWSQI